MAIVSASSDRLVDRAVEPEDRTAPPLRVSSNPAHAAERHGPTAAEPASSPLVAAESALQSGFQGSAPVTHRRRSRWFELNPGCFGRAALAAGGLAVAMAAGAGALWTLRWVRRGRRLVRAVGMVREADRQLRRRS